MLKLGPNFRVLGLNIVSYMYIKFKDGQVYNLKYESTTGCMLKYNKYDLIKTLSMFYLGHIYVLYSNVFRMAAKYSDIAVKAKQEDEISGEEADLIPYLLSKTQLSGEEVHTIISEFIFAGVDTVSLNHNMPCRNFAYAKTKTHKFTAKLISAFVFAKGIVQSLFFLNPNFQGRKPRRPVFLRWGSIILSSLLH